MGIMFDSITKRYKNVCVMNNFSLELPDSGIVCILGPSGCGKTTLVNILSGLINPDSGKVIGVNEKDISFVFQEDRLIPWITAEQNVTAVISGENKLSIARDILRCVNLLEFKDKKPNELSGGMRRRVSIARALVYKSNILIMDEPLKGLDSDIKDSIIKLIKEKQEDKLIILITHSIYEALMLSDLIYVFSGPPLKINNVIDIDLSFDKRIGNKDFISFYREKVEPRKINLE